MFDYNYMMVKMSTFHLRIFLLHNNLGSLLFFLFFVCFCCLTEIIKTCFMLGCYTAIFNITAETLGLHSPQESSFPKIKDFHVLVFWISQEKSRLIHFELLQRYLVKLLFLLKNNNFLLLNPLLAAIDLREALPRVIHDNDQKIHCRIQTERTLFFYIGWYD